MFKGNVRLTAEQRKHYAEQMAYHEFNGDLVCPCGMHLHEFARTPDNERTQCPNSHNEK